ncbi:hypothetical protein BXT84_10375 [Sulfobacillus thermotolerans]|uniref:Beta-ketoacyl synthase N-terminal domain-containing protein n=1 Tax=Sulfobacillus thermotolerans TaxID=338644 RepID=A0ABN5H1R0_9FIRM|nr:hypothetical protein BXT84_10375 [Sulfobacillus thermotolerans]
MSRDFLHHRAIWKDKIAIVTGAGRGICVDQPIWNHLAGKIGATDSLKCAYYTTRRSLGFSLGSIEACIEASLKGAIGE